MKKLISLLLSAVMVFGLIAIAPITAGAEEEEQSLKIYFDATGWDDVDCIMAHVWKTDGTGEWLNWGDTAEKCVLEDNGLWSYDLTQTGNEISAEDGNVYCVIFAADDGVQMTSSVLMSGSCIGDTAYLTGDLYENAWDETEYVVKWRNNPDCGSVKEITSSGKVIGTGLPEGVTNENLLAQYLVLNIDEDSQVMVRNTQNLLEELNVTPDDVMLEVFEYLYTVTDLEILTEEEAEYIKAYVSYYLYSYEEYALQYVTDEYGIYNATVWGDMVVFERVGKYVLYSPGYGGKSLNGKDTGTLFIKYEGEMYSIPDACEKGIADIEDLASILAEDERITFYLLGDANCDNLLDINDATEIQMHLAGLTALEYEQVSDFNGDGIVDINDVTLIQMKLAGYNV